MTVAPKFVVLEDRIVLDGADPVVELVGPAEPVQLGDQDVPFTLTFDNDGTESGYVPYAELIIPTSGGDGEGDGPSFDSASFLGAPVTTTELTFDASGEVEHPFLLNPDGSPFIVTGGMEGDTLVVFELPYGSFPPGNPPVDIDILIDFSDQADLNSLPNFQALGGFALGCDAVDNPDTDPPVRGTSVSEVVDPGLFEVTKVNTAPESEAATGPSYIYQYILTVDVAPGQTLDNFTLTDSLPPELVYMGNVSIVGGSGGTVSTEPTVGNQVQPGDELVVNFSEVSGTVTVTFDYWVSNDPSDSAAPTNPADTGVPSPINNSVTGEGEWQPLDPDDDPIDVSDSDTDVMEASTLAIQKSNVLLTDNNAPGASPGDVYEFTLEIQVSDYFTFGDLVVEDLLGDGWNYLDNSATFVSSQESGSSSGSLSGVEIVSEDDPSPGTTRVSWDLSTAMGGDGLLIGDIAGDGASSGTQTTVTITYQAEIRREYENLGGSGESNVGQGDRLRNDVTVTGNVRDNADPTTPTANDLSEDSASFVEIARGGIESKSVFALNGDTNPPADVVIAAGDTVTFQIIYRAPLAAFEDFRIEDNLPQLVFDADDEFNPATTWVNTPTDRTAPPAAGTAYFGASTSASILSEVPTISTDGPNNGLIFELGTFTEATPEAAVIEILFTATVEDAIFAPDLFLTNQATAFETNSFGEEIDTTAIAQFNYAEPELNISKGVVATDATDPETQITGSVGLSGVTVPDTDSPRFSGTFNSDDLAANDVDANIENIDAGDVVTFAIVLENTGDAPNGAFNVNVTDTLPDGFDIPGSGLNLSVTDGTGAAIGFTAPDGSAANPEDLFTTGLMLNDGGPLDGSIAAYSETSGENIVVITYDLIVNDDVSPNDTLTNTAGIAAYNAFEGNGEPFSSDPDTPVNRVVDPIEDDATATTEEIEINKFLDARQFDGDIGQRAGNEVAVGENFEFVVRVDVPEGVMFNTVISDAVTNGGLNLVSATIETMGANFTSSTGVGETDSAPVIGNAWSFDFGTLENAGDNDATNDFIEIRVVANADDGTVGNANHFMRNVARVEFDNSDGESFRDSDPANLRLIEPQLELDKRVTPTTVVAGSRVFYEVEVDNPVAFRDAPAFDLTLSDVLDPDLTLDAGSITLLVNGTPTAFDGTNFALTTNVGGDANAFDVFIDRLDQGDTILVRYEADVSETVASGKTLPNTADLVFDSTPEDDTGADSDDREYSLSDSEEIITQAPQLDKSIVPGSTSYVETTGSDLGIGELVTFEFTVTVPEGSLADVVLTDTLPTGFEYVSSEVIRIGDVTAPGINGPADQIGGSLLNVGQSGSSAGAVTTFNFGSLTNAFDGTTDSKDEITVQVTARVTSTASTPTLTNVGQLAYTDGNGDPQSVSDDETVSVVEPLVTLDKGVSPATADAGDTVTYSVTAENTGDGPAYDMIITDDVVGLDVTALGTATITILDDTGSPVTPVDAPSFVFSAGALEVVVPVLEAGHSVVVEYDAVVEDSALFSSTYTNTAEVARYDSNPAGDETTPPVDPEEERTYAGPTATSDVTTPDATLDKSFLSSDDANTGDGPPAELNVGELVTYELTITVPEGTANITLTDDLPPGLLVQSAEVVSIGDDASDSSTTLAAGATDADPNITINGARDQVLFDFGTVVIDGGDDAAATDTTIVVRVTSIVDDVAAASAGSTLTNTATLAVTDPVGGGNLQPPVTATENVEVVEPDLVMDKVGPVGADPGDVVDYSITVTNTGTGPAYDATIVDTFSDPNLTYQTGTAQVFLNNVLLAPQPTIVEPGGGGFEVQDLTILAGDVIRVDFQVELSPTAPEAETFTNTATVTYDSVEGDPVDEDGTPRGRDDSDSDDHNIATVPRIEKTPFTSQFGETDSELGSSPFDLAIGEEVTYRYEITLPEVDLESVVASDALPAGLEFVSVNVVDVNGTGAAGTVATTDLGGNVIEFDFGAMNNPSDGSIGADDVLVFDVVARVIDDGSANAGDTLTNTVTLDVDPVGGDPFGSQTAEADVYVVEPEVEIEKTGPLALSPGGPAGEFEIRVTNTGATGAEGPAYDLDIADALPAGMILDTGSFSFADASGALLTPESFTANASSFLAEFALLNVGETIVITYEASLDAGEGALTTFENTASADYFSVPEDTLDGDGNPVARDYVPVEDTHLVSTLPTLDKDAVASEHSETPEDGDTDGVQDLAIGETVTYALTLTLPEIPMDTVTLTDSLPSGLSYVSAEVTGVGSEITVGGFGDAATVNANATILIAGQDLTITLDDVVNTFVDGTINAAQDAITIEVVARVDDDPANVGALPNTQLTNAAGLTVTPEGEAPLTEVTTTETVEIVEPNLTVEKTGDPAVNPGDEVDYALSITNDGNGSAFDITVADTFGDPNLSLLSGTVQISLDGTDITGSVTVNEVGDGFNFTLAAPFQIDPGVTLDVTYTALLDAAAPDANTFLNTATVEYDGLPGDPVDENGDPVDDRDYTGSDDNAVATVPFLTKEPTASSFAETDSTAGSDPFDLNIGEEVTFTYELYLPEIDLASVQFNDNLPDGLDFVSVNASYGVGLTDLSDNPLAQPTFASFGPNDFVLDFGGVRNTEDTAPPTIGPDDIITLTVVARVSNDGTVGAGDVLTNAASLEVVPVGDDPFATVTAESDVRVVEPELEIDKVGPVALDPGDTGTYEITVQNSGPDITPEADGVAYDVVIDDVLPADLELTGPVTITLNNAPYTPGVGELTTTANGFTLNLDEMLPDDVLVITYDATLDPAADALGTFINTATANYDSAPGDPVDGDGNPVEQTYDPVSDDHTLGTRPTLEKTAIASGFAETPEDADTDGDRDVQIGETVTYELVVTLPEFAMETVTFTDTLPTGLSFVSAEITELGGFVTVGGSGDVAAINAGATFVDSGQLLTLSLSDVLNSDTDGTGDRANDGLVIEITARVDDIPANAGVPLPNTELTNTAGVVIDPEGPDAPLDEITTTETIEIVEPALELTKSGEVAGDPGQPVEYSISVTNTGNGTAFDVTIADALADPSLSFVPGSVEVLLNDVALAPQPTVTSPVSGGSDGFETVLSQIAPGDTVTVTFSALIDANAPVAEAFTNTATVIYDSAPGDPVDDDGNPVGRDGSDSDDHSVVNGPGLDKVAFTSEFAETDSEAGSTPFELTVGEEVTYRYAITLPEIALDSVIVTDLLPTGTEFVAVSVVDVNGTGAAGTVTATPDGGNPNLVTFDFGAMTNASDGSIGADDVLVFDVTARVLSDGSADAGDTLTNTATLLVEPAGDDPFVPVTDDADVTIVEPLLEIVKDGPLAMDPGDTDTFTLTITNVGDPAGAGPAFDLTVSDVLPPELLLNPGSLSYAIDGTSVSPTAVTATAGGFDAEFPVLQDGSTLVVTYTSTLDAAVTPVTSFINEAEVGYDSVPGDPVDESGNPVGENYTPVTDDHVTSTGPTLTKEPISTQFAETEEDGDGDGILGLVIGESVTYELVLTLPEISMDSVVLTDILPTGLEFVSAAVVDTGSEVSIDGITDISNSGQVMTITMADVTNAYVDGTIAAGEDTITVEVTARAVDISGNVQDTQLTNTAGLVVTPAGEPALDEVIDTATVEILEPRITIDKSTTTLEPFVGDNIVYTVTITNDAAATSPAFNTVVTDNLPFELSLTGNVVLSDPTLGSVSTSSGSGSTMLIVTIPILQPGESLTIEYETFVGFRTDVLTGITNTADYDGGSTPIADDPNGRDYSDSDTEIIVPQPVPDDDEDRRTRAIDGIDDAQFLPILLIDPIYTGTAEPGSNVTVNLYKQDGSLDYVRNIVADTGGHWIAIFPRVQVDPIDDRFHEEHATSILFDAPVQLLDRERLDTFSYRNDLRVTHTESNLLDEAYTLGVTADRPSTLPDDAGMYNTRTYFAPAHVGEIYGNADVLKVDEIFDDIAHNVTQTLYAATADPLGASLNRFNYEFLSAQTAVPGRQ